MRTFFREHKADFFAIIILCLITIAASVAFIFVSDSNKNNHIANIYHGNDVILSFDLSKESEERDISLKEYGLEMTLTVKNNAIRVKDSDCHSKACIHSGYINEGNIICAYNRVVIRIESSSYDLEVD